MSEEMHQHGMQNKNEVGRIFIHKENPKRCNNVSEFLLFHIYMKLNMFRATHRPSSGA
jgi:hypothetical protein